MHLIYSLLHPIVRKAMSLGRKKPLIVEGEVPAEQPLIFVANHFCIHDIPAVGEAIKRHAYVLVSGNDKNTFGGLILSLNGVVWVNRLDKASRRQARDTLVRHLKNGHSVLIFPEATWNLSADLLMLPMSYGVIDIANAADVPIVPVTTYLAEDAWYVRIGEPFKPTADKLASIAQLRDIMATSIYGQIERYGQARRREIADGYAEQSIQQRYDEYSRARKDPTGVRAYESQFIFKPRNVANGDEAFAHLSAIPCNMNTAFLWNKRLTGRWP